MCRNQAGSTARRLRLIGDEEEDAQPIKRCDVQRNEWKKHRECDSEMQKMENMPWTNQKIRDEEDTLPRLDGKTLESGWNV